MVSYVHTKHCYRAFILNHFNELIEPCDNCGNCRSKFSKADKTTEAQKILSAAYYLKQQYSQAILINVLKGKNIKKIKENGLKDITALKEKELIYIIKKEEY